MNSVMRTVAACGLAGAVAAAAGCPAGSPVRPTRTPQGTVGQSESGEPLAFSITEGEIDNHFFRRGAVAAHLLTRSGERPRIIVAFPAGNVGVGVWFETPPRAMRWTLERPLQAVEREDGMRGITAVLRCDARRLRANKALLASVWSLRGWAPEGIEVPSLEHRIDDGPPLRLRRTLVDGKHHLALELELLDGGRSTAEGPQRFVLQGAADQPLRMRLTALSDQPPLTPIPERELLAPGAADSPADARALAFLSYREKLLAGSWRFLTYFGRDTLLSLRLLMPVLRPPAIEAALGAVIERLSPTGQVAHEEHIGELAAIRNRKASPPPAELQQPLYDYKMVDDDFMLAPVLAAYLLDTPGGRARTAAFLARKTTRGESYAAAVRRNLALAVQLAAPFANSGRKADLIALRPGQATGEWRDSETGLGGGRYPFNVNAALVPAALRAAARLYGSPALGGDAAAATRATRLAGAWQRAEQAFRFRLPHADAVAHLQSYAKLLGLDPAAAIASLSGDLEAHALALDANGKPIPVIHSDDSFMLMFGDPPPRFLEQAAGRLLRPFPAGLRTPVGIVVANPAFADDRLRALFTTRHYHGTVIWSWQQAMLAAGLRRQLTRTDLPPPTRARLRSAERTLWQVIDATRSRRGGELWSFSVEHGRVRPLPFGAQRSHHDESNAVQLWSTVYLAVHPPR